MGYCAKNKYARHTVNLTVTLVLSLSYGLGFIFSHHYCLLFLFLRVGYNIIHITDDIFTWDYWHYY